MVASPTPSPGVPLGGMFDAYVRVARFDAGIIVDAFGGANLERRLIDALEASLAADGVPAISRPLPGRLFAGDDPNMPDMSSRPELVTRVATWCLDNGVEAAFAEW